MLKDHERDITLSVSKRLEGQQVENRPCQESKEDHGVVGSAPRGGWWPRGTGRNWLWLARAGFLPASVHLTPGNLEPTLHEEE